MFEDLVLVTSGNIFRHKNADKLLNLYAIRRLPMEQIDAYYKY